MTPASVTVLAEVDKVIVTGLGTPIDSAEFTDALATIVTKHGAASLLRALILSRAELIARRLREQISHD